MRSKKYILPLLEVVELEREDVITASISGETDNGDNVYEYDNLFGQGN